jgi:aryl-alcohol dehydrogenase-like predicted oxidoreductase
VVYYYLSRDQVKRRVLDVLRREGTDLSVPDLVQILGKEGEVPAQEITAALHHLVEKEKIEAHEQSGTGLTLYRTKNRPGFLEWLRIGR